MRDTLLAALVPYGQVLHLMMEHTGSQLQVAKLAVERPRFDAVESERLINEAAVSLRSLIRTAAHLELVTCHPSSHEVRSFVEATTGALQEMVHTVAFCKAITRLGDVRKRNVRLES